MRMIGLFAMLIAAQDALPSAAAASFNPRAVELFERDWVLNQWAAQFDANGDGIISVAEAQRHHLVGALVGQRPAEQIALDGVAAEVAHPLEILGGLDAFGGDVHPEALGELDDRLDDRDVLRPRAGFADEAAVDLQLVEDRLVQIADRRIAGAEIVERDADAERAEALQHVERRLLSPRNTPSVTSSSSRLPGTL